MKTQSAKAKGRKLQQWFRDRLIDVLEIHEEDIESRSMGAGGEDLIMARAAREKFPYSVECKNQEKINIWESYKQADMNSKVYEPVVVLKKLLKKMVRLTKLPWIHVLQKVRKSTKSIAVLIQKS